MEADKWACVDCGTKTVTLHVHHLYYERGKEPWEYPVDDLVTLCEDCHSRRTVAMKKLHIALKGQNADDIASLATLCSFGTGAGDMVANLIDELWAEIDQIPASRE